MHKKPRKELPNLTEGPILRALISLAIPIIFANILQTAYQLIDTFWVGRLGVEAVAAVSLSFPILFLLISLAGGLAIAGTIMVAHHKGRRDLEQVDYISAQTLLMMLIAGTASSVVGYFLSAPLLGWMADDPQVLPDAIAYLQTSFAGLIFVFGFFVYQSLMRGVGDVKTPLVIVLGTVLLNLVLDPLFILGYGPIPAYGVTGAAVATVFTQGLATLIGMTLLFSGRQGVHIKREHLKFDFPVIKKMFFLGMPASISQSARALGMMLMTFLVASFGTITVASYGIGTRILSLIIVPAIGLSMATSTLVGQNLGAGRLDRAHAISRICSLLSFFFLTLVGLVIFVFAEPLVGIFITDDQAALASGALFVRIMSLSFGLIGVQQTLNGTFQGAGDTRASMLLSLLALLVVQIPLAYLFSKILDFGPVGIYAAFPLTNIIIAAVTVRWYQKGDWHKQHAKQTGILQSEVLEEVIIEEGVQ